MSAANKKIKLMPDYQCWSIWNLDIVEGEDYNIDPNTLPISNDLKVKLSEWEGLYDATLDKNDPINSGFKTEFERKNFNDIGISLFDRLRSELLDFEVEYFGEI